MLQNLTLGMELIIFGLVEGYLMDSIFSEETCAKPGGACRGALFCSRQKNRRSLVPLVRTLPPPLVWRPRTCQDKTPAVAMSAGALLLI